MFYDLLATIFPYLISLFAAIASWALARFVAWMESKRRAVEARAESEKILFATRLAAQAVAAAEEKFPRSETGKEKFAFVDGFLEEHIDLTEAERDVLIHKAVTDLREGGSVITQILG